MPKNVTLAAHTPLQPIRAGLSSRAHVDQVPVKVNEYFMDAGGSTNPHTHDNPQFAFTVSGKWELTMDGETTRLSAGDSYYVAPNTTHGIKCLEKGSYLMGGVHKF